MLHYLSVADCCLNIFHIYIYYTIFYALSQKYIYLHLLKNISSVTYNVGIKNLGAVLCVYLSTLVYVFMCIHLNSTLLLLMPKATGFSKQWICSCLFVFYIIISPLVINNLFLKLFLLTLTVYTLVYCYCDCNNLHSTVVLFFAIFLLISLPVSRKLFLFTN